MTISLSEPCLCKVQQVPGCIFSSLPFSYFSPRQPDCVPPIHVLAPFDFCFINTPLRQPLIPPCLSVVFLDFLYASHLSSVPSHSNSFSVKPVLCPFHCSLSALWFPAVSSRHQLTFSSVFGMTTNSGSRQPVSASSPKTFTASQPADSCCRLH